MEEQTTGLDVSEMAVTTTVSQPQVMIEKWLLVLLIVGCTSLVFLVCFPIDFYLYRRRKRLARERKNITFPWYRSQTPSRAAQVHATLTVTKVAAEIDFEDMNAKDRKAYRAQRGIMRFLSKIRGKKSNRQKHEECLADSKSENSSDCRILTTPETTHTLASAEYKMKNNFRDRNDHNSNTHVQEFDEMKGECKLSMETFDPHEGNLACARKFPDVSNSWGENDELVDHEVKQLNYGAFEPLENMTSFSYETTETNCFTIPVRGRNMVLVKPGNDLSESYTDFENSETNGSHQDIIVESKTDIEKSVLVTNESEVNEVLTNDKSDKTSTDSKASTDSLAQEVISTSHEFNDDGDELEIDNHRGLLQSNSDQCVSYHSKHPNVTFKSMMKGNVVSPTDKDAPSVKEQFCKENYSLNNRRTFSLSTTLEETPLTSNMKKKKRKSSLLRKTSDSMPELKLYQKENF